MPSAGVDQLFFLNSNVRAEIYHKILENFMFPSADKLCGDADFIFQNSQCFFDRSIGVPDWAGQKLLSTVKNTTRDTQAKNARAKDRY